MVSTTYLPLKGVAKGGLLIWLLETAKCTTMMVAAIVTHTSCLLVQYELPWLGSYDRIVAENTVTVLLCFSIPCE